jgi:hypothetical protein
MLPQLNAAHLPRLSDDTLPIFSKEDCYHGVSLSSFQREQRVLRWRAKRRRQKVKERAVAELAATKRKNRKVLAIGRERVSGRFVRSKSALEFIPWSTVTAATAEARF